MRERRLYINGFIITMDQEGSEYPKGYIAVDEKGRIEAVGAMEDVTAEQWPKVIDLKGAYVMPGLIDAHVHMFLNGPLPKNMTKGPSKLMKVIIHSKLGYLILKQRYKNNMKKLIESGVTTIRDVGSAYYLDVLYRDKVASGQVAGPRVIACGPIITTPDGHGSEIPTTIIAKGPDAFRHAVRKNLEKKVDWIKVCSTGGLSDSKFIGEAGMPFMTYEELAAVCDEAHQKNIMVATHCQSVEGMEIALEAGVDTIEHGADLSPDMAGEMNSNENALRGYTSIVPTLSALNGFEENRERILKCPDNIIPCKNADELYKKIKAGLKTALDHHVKVGIGTDASLAFVTHRDSYKELLHFKENTHLDNQSILRLATIGNAEILGIDGITGSLETGKEADFITFHQNPLADLSVLAKPDMVVAKGRRGH